ncbi:plastocyanin/azurin family copper-binding protein [Streptomyces sp. NPDC047072]|uniref:plastocyanin/azurin family copper-binding protein n=1 Tax=Streptomyces sp. NPDC047072 TaxID=3154809 RepID=UPI00340A2D82
MKALRGAAVLVLLFVWLLPAGQASSASYSVSMHGYAFSPASLSVPAGATVTWTNHDTAPHDVKTTSGPVAIHSPMLSKGQSWSFTFTAAGSYGYYCTVHPDMTAGIVVRAAVVAAPTPSRVPVEPARSRAAAVPSPQRTPTPSAVRSMPGMEMPVATPTPTATPTPAPAVSPVVVPQAATQTTASAVRPLDPLLVLTGIVAGVAVLCLLLVGSRARQGGAS